MLGIKWDGKSQSAHALCPCPRVAIRRTALALNHRNCRTPGLPEWLECRILVGVGLPAAGDGE
jgi:hypothetical protein